MALGFALMFLIGFNVPGGEGNSLLAQTGGAMSGTGVSGGTGGSPGRNLEVCADCYRKLQKDNRDCESLQGQDWKICREAAATAYRRCSKGC